eukprot:5773254-Prymnesium_polylepis.1
MGGPRIPYRVGRIDATGHWDTAPDGNLPGAHGPADHLRFIFYRMGFNDQEVVALSGAHTLGRCHPQNSGFNGPWTLDPLKFDNQFYVALLHKNFTWTVAYTSTGADVSQFNHASDGTMMLASDMALVTDAAFRPDTE